MVRTSLRSKITMVHPSHDGLVDFLKNNYVIQVEIVDDYALVEYLDKEDSKILLDNLSPEKDNSAEEEAPASHEKRASLFNFAVNG